MVIGKILAVFSTWLGVVCVLVIIWLVFGKNVVNQYIEVMKTKMKKKNKNLRSNFRILNAQKN